MVIADFHGEEAMEAEGLAPNSLDWEGWQEAILRTQLRLTTEPEEMALSRALRRAFYLSQLTPGPIRPTFATECSEDSFEKLLEAGDLEGAARALLTSALELQISKPDGKVIAVIEVSGGDIAGTGISSHPAAALLTAWANCISAVLSTDTDAEAVLNPDRHISQRGSRPSSTQH